MRHCERGHCLGGAVLSHTPATPPPPTGRSPCPPTTPQRHLHASTVTPIAAAQLTSGVLSGAHLADALRHAGAHGLRRRPNWQSHTAKPVRRPHTHTRTTAQRTAKGQERAAVQPSPCTGPVRAPPPRSPPVAPSTAALFMLACDRSFIGTRFTPSLQRLIHELEKKSQNVQARPNANHDGSHWGALCHTLGARAAMQTGSMQTTGACDSAHDARRARAWRFLSTSSAGAGGNWLVAGAGVRCAAQPGARGGGVDRAGDPEGSRVHTIYRLWSKA